MCERAADALEDVNGALAGTPDRCDDVMAVGHRLRAPIAAFGSALSCLLMSAEALESYCRTHGVTSRLQHRHAEAAFLPAPRTC
jgi:hypothetical protein